MLGDMRTVGKHLVDTDGSVICRPDMMVGDCQRYLEAGSPSPLLDLVAVDVCPVPQPDRQRGSVQLRGRVHLDARGLAEPWASFLGMPGGGPFARFVPESVMLRSYVPPGTYPSTPVAVEDFAVANPDFLAGWESEWIAHLDAHHCDQVELVVATRFRLGAQARVRALRAHERGLDVRVYQAGGVSDLQVPFPAQVQCGCRAVRAFNEVLVAAGAEPVQ